MKESYMNIKLQKNKTTNKNYVYCKIQQKAKNKLDLIFLYSILQLQL